MKEAAFEVFAMSSISILKFLTHITFTYLLQFTQGLFSQLHYFSLTTVYKNCIFSLLIPCRLAFIYGHALEEIDAYGAKTDLV